MNNKTARKVDNMNPIDWLRFHLKTQQYNLSLTNIEGFLWNFNPIFARTA